MTFEVHARYATGFRKGEWQAWLYDTKADAIKAFTKMIQTGEFIDDGSHLDRARIMTSDGKIINEQFRPWP